MASLADRARKANRAEGARIYDHALDILRYEDTAPPGVAEDASEAIDVLEQRFDGIGDVAQLGADEYNRTNMPGRLQDWHRRNPRKPKQPNQPKSKQPAAPRSRPRREAAAAAGGYLLGRRSGARRAARAVGLEQAGRSATSSVLFVIGSIIALAVLYDILTAGEAPAKIIQGITTVVQRIVLPVDPIAGAAAAASSSSASPGSTGGSRSAPAAASSGGLIADVKHLQRGSGLLADLTRSAHGAPRRRPQPIHAPAIPTPRL